MGIIDVLFSDFRWYRQLCGGIWYHTLDLPFLQGGFDVWSRDAPLGIPHIALGHEVHRKTKIYWQRRCEELEVVTAALYLGHNDAKEQMDRYKTVYLTKR